MEKGRGLLGGFEVAEFGEDGLVGQEGAGDAGDHGFAVEFFAFGEGDGGAEDEFLFVVAEVFDGEGLVEASVDEFFFEYFLDGVVGVGEVFFDGFGEPAVGGVEADVDGVVAVVDGDPVGGFVFGLVDPADEGFVCSADFGEVV